MKKFLVPLIISFNICLGCARYKTPSKDSQELPSTAELFDKIDKACWDKYPEALGQIIANFAHIDSSEIGALKKELHQAIEDNDVSKVAEIINIIRNFNLQNIILDTPYYLKENRTPLQLAIIRRRDHIAEILIHAGASIGVDIYGDSALAFAIRSNSKSLVKLLIDKKANVHERNADGSTLLIRALRMSLYNPNSDDLTAIVKMLIDARIDVNAKDRYGQTALLEAIESRWSNIAGILIEAGADVNARDISGNTPLKVAAETNQHEIIKLIISAQSKKKE